MILVTVAYIESWTDGRTDGHDVMAIKPNFLASMGYHIFLTMVLRARGAPLLNIYQFITSLLPPPPPPPNISNYMNFP